MHFYEFGEVLYLASPFTMSIRFLVSGQQKRTTSSETLWRAVRWRWNVPSSRCACALECSSQRQSQPNLTSWTNDGKTCMYEHYDYDYDYDYDFILSNLQEQIWKCQWYFGLSRDVEVHLHAEPLPWPWKLCVETCWNCSILTFRHCTKSLHKWSPMPLGWQCWSPVVIFCRSWGAWQLPAAAPLQNPTAVTKSGGASFVATPFRCLICPLKGMRHSLTLAWTENSHGRPAISCKSHGGVESMTRTHEQSTLQSWQRSEPRLSIAETLQGSSLNTLNRFYTWIDLSQTLQTPAC